MQEEHQSYKLFANILQGATNYVDALGKKSPLIGKVTDTSLQLAQPLIKQLKPVLDYSIEVADNTVDKAIDRGVTVVNRARNIRTKADKVRAEKASKFVAAACDAWSKLHANPGPVSFAELQGQLRALYTQSVESVSKPANQIWRVARESNGDSLVVRVRKVWDETHTVLIERVEFAVIFAERAVDTYLPPPMPLTDVAEPQDLSVQQHTKPLVVRVMQLPVTVTRRVGSKAMQQIDFSKVKLRTREAVDSFVHIDLMAYASGQTDAIPAYAKCQAANMTNALALAKERAVNSYTHARAHLEQIAAVVPRPQELQQRLMDPERREQLRQALKQMIENLRVKAEESRVYGVLYGKKAAKFLLVHCSDILQVTMKKLPDEAKQALFNTIKQAEMCVRYMLGDKATEQAVAYATQLLVSAWVFADMRADEPQGGAAPAPARAQETQEAEETATPRQSKKKGGKKQQ